ncbi:uncharacterized protein LOC123515920 isoform X2 [Portunus trituberculatus]|uniref:uncharacterized protein LOC123515920 isoform X2 n=1 Tax=Portunus trituberculatus TaxID=210409 RepID=UPI001E1D0FE6|nr:uncharacterized protein LOC123515920 isoform X2 [Portunus trituberculatus]
MQITGVATSREGSDGRPAEEDTLTPFLTPQHLAKTPAQSFFSVINSKDSLDQYHDAYSTLTRPHHTNGHASASASIHALPTTAATRGGYRPLDASEPSAYTFDGAAGRNDIVGSHGRVRHASHSAAQPPFTTPPHIGRLSLSTTSLKRVSADSPYLLAKPPSRADSSPVQLVQKTGNWRQNYRPCVEMVRGGGGKFVPIAEAETTATQKPMVSKPYHVIENNNDDGWRRNYVECVEGRALLLGDEGGDDGGGGGGGGGGLSPNSQEVHLAPARLTHLPPKDAELHMYSFAPVQQRRAGLQRLRDEFRLENLYLQHKVPHLFVSSQWQQHNRMSCLYLGYRLFWALYFSMWAVWAWVGSMGYDAPASLKIYFPTYLTNWSIWTLAADTSLQAVNVILHLKKIADDGDVVYPSMTRLMKTSWVLSNIMGPVHLFVALGYWIVVYPNRSDESLNEIGINTHIMPALYILLDVAVSATPRRLVHVYQPIIFVFSYVFFNLMYYLCGGLDYLGRPALYPFMDWTQPGSTIGIMFVSIFGVIPFLHAVICLLCASRINMWRRLKISRYAREEDEMDQVDGPQEQKV